LQKRGGFYDSEVLNSSFVHLLKFSAENPRLRKATNVITHFRKSTTKKYMEQRDYLKKQIDQLGQVLAKLFSDLIGLKNSGQSNSGLEITDQVLKNELDFDLQDFIDIPTDKFIDTLTAQKGLTKENLDKLADILLLIADNREGDNKKLFEKCLMIYEYLEKVDNIYSLDRKWKMKRIENEL
jgi:hypothetical protein